MAAPSTFAARVLAVVRRIPPGRVATYGDVAALAGTPTDQAAGTVPTVEGDAAADHLTTAVHMLCTFEAWRILLRNGRAVRTAWISIDPPHRVVRWDNGEVIFELVKAE